MLLSPFFHSTEEKWWKKPYSCWKKVPYIITLVVNFYYELGIPKTDLLCNLSLLYSDI